MELVPIIHVGILKKNILNFKLAGKFKIEETKKICFNDFEASLYDNKIVVCTENEKMVFGDEVTFTPCNITADHFEVKDVTIGIDFHWEQKKIKVFKEP